MNNLVGSSMMLFVFDYVVLRFCSLLLNYLVEIM